VLRVGRPAYEGSLHGPLAAMYVCINVAYLLLTAARPMRVTITTENSGNCATTMFRTDFSGHV